MTAHDCTVAYRSLRDMKRRVREAVQSWRRLPQRLPQLLQKAQVASHLKQPLSTQSTRHEAAQESEEAPRNGPSHQREAETKLDLAKLPTCLEALCFCPHQTYV